MLQVIAFVLSYKIHHSMYNFEASTSGLEKKNIKQACKQQWFSYGKFFSH